MLYNKLIHAMMETHIAAKRFECDLYTSRTAGVLARQYRRDIKGLYRFGSSPVQSLASLAYHTYKLIIAGCCVYARDTVFSAPRLYIDRGLNPAMGFIFIGLGQSPEVRLHVKVNGRRESLDRVYDLQFNDVPTGTPSSLTFAEHDGVWYVVLTCAVEE